tara:strand:- start:222 stop:596 length:375 start_codon:yes stop_codon:yes gene_type:complete
MLFEQMSEKDQLLSMISDVHKDAYGFRPRGLYTGMTVKELEVELDRLCEAASEEADRIEKLEAENWKALKKHLSGLVDIGAKDFRQALAWDMQAEDVPEYDFGYYCFHKGVAYSKERVLARLAA